MSAFTYLLIAIMCLHITSANSQAIGGVQPDIGGTGSRVGNGVGAVTTILNYVLELPGRCCRPIVEGGYCGDGSHGTPFCAYERCNIYGCNCDGGCRSPPGGIVIAVVYQHLSYNRGLANLGKSQAISLPANTCVSFEWYSDRITGIAVINNCVKIWEHRNCEGASMCLCQSTDNLRRYEMRDGINWNDEISSMSQC